MRTLFLLLAGLLSVTASGQFRSDGQDVAIFFANQDYGDHPDFGDLKNPVGDARALAKLLEQQYGFTTKVHTDLTRAAIEEQLRQLRARRFGPKDQLFLFFTGHGSFRDFEGEGYYVCSGKGNTEIPLRTLGSIVTQIDCPHLLLTIDACYSGTILSEVALKGRGQRPGVTEATRRQRLIESKLAYPSRLLLTSGGKERTSDGLHHSPLTEAFLAALRGAQTTGDGLLTYTDLLAGLERVEPRPRHGSLTGHQQGSFVFVGPVAAPQTSTPPPPPMVRNTPSVTPGNLASVSTRVPALQVVHGGQYDMGSALGQARTYGAHPVHRVRVQQFYLAPREVTFADYDVFCTATDRTRPDDEGWGRDDRPVINVSWFDALSYCNWLSSQHGLRKVYQFNGSSVRVDWEADGYRLPTEAEWEFVAGGGVLGQEWRFGDGSDQARCRSINFDCGSQYRGGRTQPVGNLPANPHGFYDLSGNVAEWCFDRYGEYYYGDSPTTDPRGPAAGSRRVIRGGGWGDGEEKIQARYRASRPPDTRSRMIGFRLARSVR